MISLLEFNYFEIKIEKYKNHGIFPGIAKINVKNKNIQKISFSSSYHSYTDGDLVGFWADVLNDQVVLFVNKKPVNSKHMKFKKDQKWIFGVSLRKENKISLIKNAVHPFINDLQEELDEKRKSYTDDISGSESFLF
jgi:hypothetical protein